MTCENDFSTVQPVEPDRLEAVLTYFNNIAELTSSYTGKVIPKSLQLSIIALSGPETGYRWNEYRENAVIFANSDGMPECNECCTPVGIEWDFSQSPNRYRDTIKNGSALATQLVNKGYATVQGDGRLQRTDKSNQPYATRWAFEQCIYQRDKKALNNFSVGPTQMWFGDGQGKIHIAGQGPEPDWDRIWAFYTGTIINSMSAAALYLDSPPYPADDRFVNNVVRWLKLQTGGGGDWAEQYYSGKQNYKDYLDRTIAAAARIGWKAQSVQQYRPIRGERA